MLSQLKLESGSSAAGVKLNQTPLCFLCMQVHTMLVSFQFFLLQYAIVGYKQLFQFKESKMWSSGTD